MLATAFPTLDEPHIVEVVTEQCHLTIVDSSIEYTAQTTDFLGLSGSMECMHDPI
jgi:hypothetical protein